MIDRSQVRRLYPLPEPRSRRARCRAPGTAGAARAGRMLMNGTRADGGAGPPRPQEEPGRDPLGPALARAALAADAVDSWGDSDRVVHLDSPAVPSALLEETPRDFVQLPEIGRTFLGFHLLAEL